MELHINRRSADKLSPLVGRKVIKTYEPRNTILLCRFPEFGDDGNRFLA